MNQESGATKVLLGLMVILLLLLVGVGGYVIGFDQGQRRGEVANGSLVNPTPGEAVAVTPSPAIEASMVWVYFSHTDRAPTDCESVFPVRREVFLADNLEQTAIEELLKGPTAEEQERGFETSIPAGVGLRSISVSGGTATVDFNQGLQQGVAGSCLVQSIRSQIEETLLQFPAVNEVVISVNGETEEVLQP